LQRARLDQCAPARLGRRHHSPRHDPHGAGARKTEAQRADAFTGRRRTRVRGAPRGGREDSSCHQEGDGGCAASRHLAARAARGRRARRRQLGRGALDRRSGLIPPATLLAFALTCVIIEITPGPNMAWLAALSIARGWRTGLAAVAGRAPGLSGYWSAAP